MASTDLNERARNCMYRANVSLSAGTNWNPKYRQKSIYDFHWIFKFLCVPSANADLLAWRNSLLSLASSEPVDMNKDRYHSCKKSKRPLCTKISCISSPFVRSRNSAWQAGSCHRDNKSGSLFSENYKVIICRRRLFSASVKSNLAPGNSLLGLLLGNHLQRRRALPVSQGA